jgi:hypothetical protein
LPPAPVTPERRISITKKGRSNKRTIVGRTPIYDFKATLGFVFLSGIRISEAFFWLVILSQTIGLGTKSRTAGWALTS